MIQTHLCSCILIDLLRMRTILYIRLTSVRQIHRLIRYKLPQNRIIVRAFTVTAIGSVIPPFGEESIVMMPYLCPWRISKRLFGRQRNLIAQILNLNKRITHQEKTIIRHGRNERIKDCSAVLIQMLTLVSIIRTVIPLSPLSYKTRLENIDHIGVLRQIRLELGNMSVHPRQRCIIFTIPIVGKTQYTFESMIAQDLHVLIKALQQLR